MEREERKIREREERVRSTNFKHICLSFVYVSSIDTDIHTYIKLAVDMY